MEPCTLITNTRYTLKYPARLRVGGINQLFFDSKYLLPYNLRITADLSYLTEHGLEFLWIQWI